MLVLSRKENERIVIDGNISITVLQILGDKVRLGIQADPSIRVHRAEIEEAIQQETATPA